VSGDPAVYEGLHETGTARARQASRAAPVAIEVSHPRRRARGRRMGADAMTVAGTWRPSRSTQTNAIQNQRRPANVRNAEADA
jgi:hypothetical protein